MDGRVRPWLGAALLAVPALGIGLTLPSLSGAAGDLLALVLTAVIVVLGLWLVRWAYGGGETDGRRAGRAAERAEARRRLHDGPLQTLEAIALEPPFAPDPTLELDRVRSAARAEATRLRSDLHDHEDGRRTLPDSLAALAAEFGENGLAVRMTVADQVPAQVSPEQHSALCAATREALTNVVKHAGTGAAVLRVDGDARTVRVIVRDHGSGMAPGESAGFGQRESLVGRMNGVGGRAQIWSRPGRGTRVTLEVDR